MIKKKVISIILAFFMAFTFSAFSFNSLIAYADDEEEPPAPTEEEMREIIESLNNDLDDLIDKNDAIGAEITALADEVAGIKEEIEVLNKDIEALEIKIKEKEIELENKEIEIAEQEKNLNARLKTMYKNGSIGYIDVLLGSNSISEFVYNIKMVKTIHEHDVEVIQILQRQHDEIEKIKIELEISKRELDDKKESLSTRKNDCEAKISELKVKQDQYESDISMKKDEIRDALVLFSGYVGGTFIWPLPSYLRNPWYITSWVGWREHPTLGGWRYHGGTDIAAPKYTPVYACGNGVVILAGWNGGYGNCVMIDHGDGIVSLYGHAEELLVSKGDVVAAGDKIMLVGSTGNSTGYHLHFEVRINGEQIDSMTYFPDIEQYRPSNVIL